MLNKDVLINTWWQNEVAYTMLGRRATNAD